MGKNLERFYYRNIEEAGYGRKYDWHVFDRNKDSSVPIAKCEARSDAEKFVTILNAE